MQVLILLLGLLFAFTALVSATPTGTPTTSQTATPVTVGPRRNGFSDLPSDALGYNYRQPENRIPDFVMAYDPEAGDNAITYARDEIYTAMQQGYEVLQHTRDPAPNTGTLVPNGNIMYPMVMDFDDVQLLDTYYGQFGRYGDAPGGQDIGNIYAWPLLWTNSWTGFNQNPGDDRVLFNGNGIYIGVITRRPSGVSPLGAYRWCPPTDAYGRWIAQYVGGRLGWNYPGVPPTGEALYNRPRRWNIASSQRARWWYDNPNGKGPVGSINRYDKSSNSSTAPTVEMNPLNATVDANDLLQFPPTDNSTGVWQLYSPRNDTTDTTMKAVPSDCTFAAEHGARLYWRECQSQWSSGASVIRYRITISGTGQNTNGWCTGIMDNIHAKCGRKGNPQSYYSCNQKYPGTVTFSTSTDPSDAGYNKYFYGIDMHFYMNWPWYESDADHACVSEAISAASCVQSDNGKWCRNAYWKTPSPLLEWANDMGPA